MQFYNYDNNKVVTLEKVAEAIAPLLRPLLQPAPADVPAVQPTDARLLALDAAKQRAEMQLADAQQANAQLTADLARRTTERDKLVAELVRQRDEAATYRAQADAARQAATEAAQRAEAAETKWEAIPWRVLGSAMSANATYNEGRAGRDWLNANRPTAQAQD